MRPGQRTARPKSSWGRRAILRLEVLESREAPLSLLELVGWGALPAGWLSWLTLPVEDLGVDQAANVVVAGRGESRIVRPRHAGNERLTHAAASAAPRREQVRPTPRGTSEVLTQRSAVGGQEDAGLDLVDTAGSGARLLSARAVDAAFSPRPDAMPSTAPLATSSPEAPEQAAEAPNTDPAVWTEPAQAEERFGAPKVTKDHAPAPPTVDAGPVLASPLRDAAASEGTLRLATPETEIIAPYPRLKPSPNTTYDGQFVVRLQPGVSSPELAARYQAVHGYEYPNLDNVNLWQTKGGLPAQRLQARLQRDARVVDAYPVYRSALQSRSLLNDPLLPAQWHLYNVGQSAGTAGVDGNVQAAWDLGVTGRGVTIGIVDNGLQYTHPDLGASALGMNANGGNYVGQASYNFNGANDDPAPVTTVDFHGTSVAGVAAAIGNNATGGSGVAPNASLGGIRLTAAGTTDSQEAEALTWSTKKPSAGDASQFDGSLVQIYNNSWGPADDGRLHSTTGPLVPAGISLSTTNGRGGLGSIYTWAGGNGRSATVTLTDNVNYDAYANNRHVIAVGALNQNGSVASYSEAGAPLLVAAPSNAGGGGEGITTTDIVGTNGYHRTNYTDDFGGTSSASPYVAGVIALMLEANPNLGWRDVQHILAQSASITDPTNFETYNGANPLTNSWVVNGGGHPVNHNYGFGIVNAAGAVNLASNWQPVGPELLVDSGHIATPPGMGNIPDNDATGLTKSFAIAPNIRVEHVEIVFDATHSVRGDLEVLLTSPAGTQSILALRRTVDNNANYASWVFSTTRHWDETSAGLWSVRVRDLAAANAGTWNSYRLRIYGTELSSDTAGPRVTNLTDVNGFVNGGSVNSFQVRFNEPINPATFTAADLNIQRVGGTAVMPANITVSAVSGTNNTVFLVSFPAEPQATQGNYRIDIGPNINDTAGNAMNQDGDLTNAEAAADKNTEFFTLANQFLYSNTSSLGIPDGGSIQRTVALPAVTLADLNVLLNATHQFVSSDLEFRLASPSVANVLIADNNTSNTSGASNNGYLDTVLDDDNASAPLIQATTTNYHYTSQYRPTNALTAFDTSHTMGNWTLTINDVVAVDAGAFNYFTLILTPTGITDIRLTSVTNVDTGGGSDRDMIEVNYTISGAAAAAFDLGVYASTDPYFNINSDTQSGTFSITAAGDLTVGPHTVKVPASQFADPSTVENKELYSLVVVDPQRNLFDYDRFNNTGILSGVTQTPDGTLYVSGDPFLANTITLTNNAGNVDVNFNGTSFTNLTANDVFVTGGMRVDAITATGVTKNLTAFLGAGSDTYTGGDATDAVQAGPGHDSLTGNLGNDRFYGMIGNDTLLGGGGEDLLSVDEGGAAPGVQSVDGGTGNDKLYVTGTTFNDRITVWDPDGDTAAIGNTLIAAVQDPANLAADSRVLETDGFGYAATMTRFEPIDLVTGGAGVLLVMDNGDNNTTAINLSTTTFSFYGTTYTGNNQLFVSANGLITFGTANTSAANGDLTTSPTQAAIAPLWDDWRNDAFSGSDDDRVLGRFDDVNNDGVTDRLVIEWNKVRRSGLPTTFYATFQAILQLNTGANPGAITFNYPDTVVDGHQFVDVPDGNLFDDDGNATVGIKDSGNPQRTKRLLVSLNGRGSGAGFVRSGRAIQIAVDPGVGQLVTLTGVETTDRLYVSAGPGNDLIQLENPTFAIAGAAASIPAFNPTRVRLPAVLVGGEGNDTITDGLGVDDLYGDRAPVTLPGDGDDVLNSFDRTAGDRLFGGGHVVGDINFTPEIGDASFGIEPVWSAVGPAPIVLDPQTYFPYEAASGRLAAMAAHPTNPNIIYVAPAGGGVWKTTDAGASWSPLTDTQSTLFMGALAIAPSNPNIIYAGTGEGANSLLSFYGRGVLKSTDGGLTWTLFDGDETGNANANRFDRHFISRIVVHPTDPNILYAATGGAGTNQLGGDVGIWKSIDGGVTWSNTTTAGSGIPGIGSNDQFSDLVMDPSDPNILYAGLWSIFAQTTVGGIYKTINGGASWTLQGAGAPSGNIVGRVKLAISRTTTPVTVYASIAGTGEAGSTAYGNLFELRRTTNGGTTWANARGDAPDYLAPQGWYDSTIIVDPANAAVVYAGGAASNSFIKTNNGTAAAPHWSVIETGVDGKGPHVDYHATAFDANGRLLVGNDGGIWRLDTPTVPTSVTIGASKDNTLYETVDGSLSNGAGDFFFVGRTGATAGNANRRGVVAFDVAGNVPAGAVITSVSLRLNMSRSAPGSGAQTIQLQRLSADWGEGTSNAAGAEGGGVASTTNDATWIHRFFSATNWATTGGDFSGTVSASTSVNATGAYTWGTTAQVVADVQSWLDTPAANFGWLLRNNNETPTSTAKRFDTRQNPTAANQPLLTIDYTGRATSWTNLNANLATTQFLGIAIHPTNPDIMFGGSQDNGTEQFQGGARWTFRVGGDGGFPQLDAGSGTPFTVYQSFQQQGSNGTAGSDFLQRSTDGGLTYTSITGSFLGAGDPSNFYMPNTFDPAQSGTELGTGRLLLGTNRVYETTTSGGAWTTRSSTNTDGWTTSAEIDSVAATPNINTIYASAGGRVFVTTDRGTSWNERNPIAADSFNEFTDFLADPQDSTGQTAYVVLASFNSGNHIWRTVNGGQNWTNLTGNLPNLPTWTVELKTNAAGAADDVVYVGTDNGVYSLTNPTSSTTWTRLGEGLPNVLVRDLRYSSQLNMLAAGTHGRGAWQLLLG